MKLDSLVKCQGINNLIEVSSGNKNYTDKHVLLVDDEPNIIIPVEFLIRQQGFQVTKVYNGLDALKAIANQCPDIIILDVMMPEMDGFEVARRIRENPDCQHVRIIFLTAKGTPSDRRHGYELGGEIYLTKPFDNDELVSIVTEMAAFG